MSDELRQIDGINRHESEYLYEEIFIRQGYLRHGLSLTDNAIVFDVGANIGIFSLFVASKCPTASIYAFEPLPPIFKKLERNMGGAYGQVHLFCCGLSDVAGEATFTYYPGYSMMSVESIYVDTAGDKGLVKRQVLKEQQRNRTVDGDILERSLDDLLDYRFREDHYQCHLRCMSDIIEEYSLPRIDFLKIDVQRAEIDVLNGIREQHWPIVQQIAMEVHDGLNDANGGRLQKLSDDLRGRGFHVEVEQDEHLSGTDRHNLFAVRPSR
jgi:FkbM family methyltransferase